MTTTEIDFEPSARRAFTQRQGPYAGLEESGVFIYSLDFEAGRKRKWNDAIVRLRDWSANPGELEDEDSTAPSGDLLRLAIRVAEGMRDEWPMPAPQRVTPTNDGGLIFERWDGGAAEVLEFLPDGTGEIKTFYGNVLLRRQPLRFAGASSMAR